MGHHEEKHAEESEEKKPQAAEVDEKETGDAIGAEKDNAYEMTNKEKHNVKDDKEYGDEKNDDKFVGIHLSKRDLTLAAGGAMGVLALIGLGRFASKLRPVAVGAVREGYAFKEWVAGKAETVKEDVQDIIAEGVHQYRKDAEAAADTVRREKDILEKVGKLVEERLARLNTAQGGE